MVILFSMVVGFETLQTKIISILSLMRGHALSGIWREARATLRQMQREWTQSLGHYLDYEAQMVTLVVEDQARFKKAEKKRTF